MFPRGWAGDGAHRQRRGLRLAEPDHAVTGAAQRRVNAQNDPVRLGGGRGAVGRGRDASPPGGALTHLLELLRGDAHARDCARAARDKSSVEQARNILAAQATREQRLEAADDVIVNTGTLAALEQFVLTLHQNYEKQAANA